MARVQPLSAAFEGFRVIRDRPQLILAWSAFYFVSLLVMILILLVPNLGNLAASTHTGGQRDFDQLLARFGPAILIVFPLAMAMITMLAAAVYRSVLRPEDKAFAYLKLGWDEARLFALSVIVLLVFTVVSGLYGLALVLLAQAVGPLREAITLLGSLGGLALVVWLGVRLSLAGAMTFADRKIRLLAAWRQTEGQFWPLLWTLGLTIIFVIAVVVLAFLLSLLLAMLMGGFSLLGELARPDLTDVTPGFALALLGQLLVQLAIQVLLIVLVLVVFYAAPCRAEQQISTP
ncbi:MAG TPA: hypothetical protein PLF78_05025 [Caulobacter sp.]|nr:hypothetical protein [Caulobacter sp.]